MVKKERKQIKKDKSIKKPKQIRRRKEKYFICPYCGELKTFTSILADCEMGGPGMCDCQFTTLYWNSECQDLDVNTQRTYHDHVQISEEWFECLGDINNDILRIDAFNQIPRLMRLE